MSTRPCFRVRLVLLAAIFSGVEAGADLPRPEPHIHQVIDAIVGEVAAARDRLENDYCLAYALVDQYLRPEFDLHFSSRMILGRHWMDDAAFQNRFVAAFYDHLVATYGDLVRFINEDTLEIIPLDADPQVESVKLGSWLTFNDGKTVRVDFSLRFIAGRWQIIDVIVDQRMSYARSFRSDFLFEISDVGFDGLVDLLEEEAALRRQCGP